MYFFRRIILSVLPVLCFQSIGLGQNLVQDFQVRAESNQIQLMLQAANEFQYEILPFDSQTYTLLKLTPLQFPAESKKQMLSPLEALPIKLQALELMDQSVMFSFKGVLARQIKINTSENHHSIEISISLISEDKHTTGERTKEESASDYYQTAVNMLAKNNYSAALTALHQSLKLKPDYAAAYLLAGKIRFQMHEWQRAKNNLYRAYKLEPNLVEAQSYLTRIATILNAKKENSYSELSSKTKNSNTESDSTVIKPNPTTPKVKAELDSTAFAFQQLSPNLTNSEKKLNTMTEYKITFAKSNRKNYFQTGLFLLIILSMAGWFFLLWRKRSLLKQAQSSKVPDFAKLLQQLQNQPALLGKDMPEFQATINPHESDFHIDKDTIYNANNEDNSLRLKESIRTKLPKSKLPAIEPNYFSQMAKQTQHESMEQKILHYAEMGFSVEEIAYRTQIGKGEVKLVLNLHGQSVPMSAPEIRIQME